VLGSGASGSENIQEATRLGEWLEAPPDQPHIPFILTLRPSWFPDTQASVQLELIKTSISHFWVVTSIPRTPLPSYEPPKPPISTSSIRRQASRNLKLADFPPPSKPSYKSSDSPTTVHVAPRGAPFDERPIEPFIKQDSEMRRMLFSYPWHTTSLGPMEQWQPSLKSCLSYVMASPYPRAVWWGSDMVLIYNDAYVEVAGNKHPGLFGQAGSVGKSFSISWVSTSIYDNSNPSLGRNMELSWATDCKMLRRQCSGEER